MLLEKARKMKKMIFPRNNVIQNVIFECTLFFETQNVAKVKIHNLKRCQNFSSNFNAPLFGKAIELYFLKSQNLTYRKISISELELS